MRSFLFHMHQPDYRHPDTGEPTMPWVRLHATRGYRDIPILIAETGAQATVNLVPSLLDQLDHYAAGGTDLHARLARQPADTLTAAQRDFILTHFFHGNPSIFKWFPAYGALRGRAPSTGSLRDVQVWSNLAWFGATALFDYPFLADLRKKGANFTEAEKSAVLDAQIEIIRDLPARYRQVPDVSASPYYHPILPLLVNTEHARRNLPNLVPPPFSAPEDAFAQLTRARTRVAGWCGKEVRGLWPSEGSVSPEVVDLAASAGYRWLATDQGILARSEGPPGDHHSPWTSGQHDVRLLFRDRGLSDRIGFQYASWDGSAAAADLVAQTGDRPVLLALDGENPWETFRDAGRDFLRAILSHRTRTCSEFAEDPPKHLTHLHTGSWINADFQIWIGDAEDHVAWRALAAARREWELRGRPEVAHESLLKAEGSDWFWWYGPEFETPFAADFDALFRAHLTAAYRAMAAAPPDSLAHPFKHALPTISPPSGPLPWDGPVPPHVGDAPNHPTFARAPDWFAWAAAGRVELRLGAMATSIPRRIEYGERAGEWVARLLPEMDGWTVDIAPPSAAIHGPSVVVRGPSGQRLPPEGAFDLPGTLAHPRGSGV